jgi:DNA repair protein RadC
MPRSAISSQALSLARELVNGRSLDDLNEMAPSALSSLGLAQAQVDTLRAAFEIARRLALNALPEREPLSQPAQIVRYLALRFRDKTQEVAGAIYLDSRLRVIATEELFRGGIARIYVEPAPILRQALARCAASLIFFHTHPSGNPEPSTEDIAFTRRLADAGMHLGVELLDHLIVGSGRWCSLKTRGLF